MGDSRPVRAFQHIVQARLAPARNQRRFKLQIRVVSSCTSNLRTSLEHRPQVRTGNALDGIPAGIAGPGAVAFDFAGDTSIASSFGGHEDGVGMRWGAQMRSCWRDGDGGGSAVYSAGLPTCSGKYTAWQIFLTIVFLKILYIFNLCT